MALSDTKSLIGTAQELRSLGINLRFCKKNACIIRLDFAQWGQGMDACCLDKPRKGLSVSHSRSRQNINIELADGVKELLESVRASNGMTQKELVARLVGWFCEQDRVVQQIILGQIPSEIAPDVAKLMLNRLTEEARSEAAPVLMSIAE